jgi:hypothetical protein
MAIIQKAPCKLYSYLGRKLPLDTAVYPSLYYTLICYCSACWKVWEPREEIKRLRADGEGRVGGWCVPGLP